MTSSPSSYYKLLLYNYFRSIFYKHHASSTGTSSISFLKSGGYVLILIAFHSLALSMGAIYHLIPEADLILHSYKNLAAVLLELFLIASASAITFTLYFDPGNGEMDFESTLPVGKRHVFISKALFALIEFGFLSIVSVTPVLIFLITSFNANLLNIIPAVIIPILGTLFYTQLACLLCNVVLSFFKTIKKISFQSIFFLPIALFFAAIILVLLNTEGKDLSLFFIHLENQAARFAGICVFGNITFDFFNTTAFLISVFTFLISLLLIYINSTFFLSNYNKLVDYHSPELITSSGKIFTNFSVGKNISMVFLKKEILQIIREPKELVTNTVLLLVTSYVVNRIFNGSQSTMLFIIYNIPFMFGSFLIHSMGREGSNIFILKMITTGKSLFLAKVSSFIILFFPLSVVIYLAMGFFITELTSSIPIIALRVFLIFCTTVLTSIYALFISTYFADYNVKRLMANRGISILGEMLYWFTGCFIGVIFLLVDRGILNQSYNTFFIGLTLAAIITAASAVLTQKSMRLINEQN